VRAFVAGMQAEKKWDLKAAEAHYRQAITHDPDFARANFRLAQVISWQQSPIFATPADPWREFIARALSRSELIEPEEAELAKALDAMAGRRFQDACKHYTSVIETNAFSFAGWYGRGKCHFLDNVVVRDSASTTGWSFRSSHHAAVEAYTRALQLEPGFVLTLGRDAGPDLVFLLYALPVTRRGQVPPPDTGRFGAHPSLASDAIAGDTLAFLPYPLADFRSGTTPTPPRYREALERNRRQVAGIGQHLVARHPGSAAALIVRAETLELIEQLEGEREEASAVAWARKAVNAAGTREEQLYASLVHVRLLVKLAHYRDARKLAASAIKRWSTDDSIQPHDLAALAALTGKSSLVAPLYQQGAVERPEDTRLKSLPLNVLQTREKLIGYAIMGVPTDTIARLADELEKRAREYLPMGVFEARKCEVLGDALDIAYAVIGRSLDDSSCWVGAARREMQWALTHEDSDRVTSVMDRLDEVRAGTPSSDIAIDVVFHEAWLLAEAGDTTRAMRHLDRSLQSIHAMNLELLRRPAQAAGLVRAMALRADLAAGTGDLAIARQWSGPVSELWRDADAPELRRIVERMNAFSRGRIP
jgi:tetratricopeptide (TPR) repeat protein